MLLFPKLNASNRAGTCNIKVFNNDTMRIVTCNDNKPTYKDFVTSTVDTKMSTKMRYSQYLRSFRCRCMPSVV